jgi:lipoate-protein ligase A
MLPLRFSPSSPSPYPTGEDLLDPAASPFRAWIPEKPLIVLGNSQSPDIELNAEIVRADGIPVYQRKGGGGTVFLDSGCVCLAIKFPKRTDWGIKDYFQAGNGLLTNVVRDFFGINAGPRGISDLAVNISGTDKKISGSSLYMPRDCALYLASVLVTARLADWDRYLRHPSREPGYRGGRTHGEFVVNLGDLGVEITAERVRDALAEKLRASLEAQEQRST